MSNQHDVTYTGSAEDSGNIATMYPDGDELDRGSVTSASSQRSYVSAALISSDRSSTRRRRGLPKSRRLHSRCSSKTPDLGPHSDVDHDDRFASPVILKDFDDVSWSFDEDDGFSRSRRGSPSRAEETRYVDAVETNPKIAKDVRLVKEKVERLVKISSRQTAMLNALTGGRVGEQLGEDDDDGAEPASNSDDELDSSQMPRLKAALKARRRKKGVPEPASRPPPKAALKPKSWVPSDWAGRDVALLNWPEDAPLLKPASSHPKAGKFLRDDVVSVLSELRIDRALCQAQAHYHFRQYDEMIKHAERALGLAEKDFGDYEPLISRCYIYLAIGRWYGDDRGTARMLFEKAQTCIGVYREGELVTMWLRFINGPLQNLVRGARKPAGPPAKRPSSNAYSIGFSPGIGLGMHNNVFPVYRDSANSSPHWAFEDSSYFIDAASSGAGSSSSVDARQRRLSDYPEFQGAKPPSRRATLEYRSRHMRPNPRTRPGTSGDHFENQPTVRESPGPRQGMLGRTNTMGSGRIPIDSSQLHGRVPDRYTFDNLKLPPSLARQQTFPPDNPAHGPPPLLPTANSSSHQSVEKPLRSPYADHLVAARHKFVDSSPTKLNFPWSGDLQTYSKARASQVVDVFSNSVLAQPHEASWYSHGPPVPEPVKSTATIPYGQPERSDLSRHAQNRHYPTGEHSKWGMGLLKTMVNTVLPIGEKSGALAAERSEESDNESHYGSARGDLEGDDEYESADDEFHNYEPYGEDQELNYSDEDGETQGNEQVFDDEGADERAKEQAENQEDRTADTDNYDRMSPGSHEHHGDKTLYNEQPAEEYDEEATEHHAWPQEYSTSDAEGHYQDNSANTEDYNSGTLNNQTKYANGAYYDDQAAERYNGNLAQDYAQTQYYPPTDEAETYKEALADPEQSSLHDDCGTDQIEQDYLHDDQGEHQPTDEFAYEASATEHQAPAHFDEYEPNDASVEANYAPDTTSNQTFESFNETPSYDDTGNISTQIYGNGVQPKYAPENDRSGNMQPSHEHEAGHDSHEHERSEESPFFEENASLSDSAHDPLGHGVSDESHFLSEDIDDAPFIEDDDDDLSPMDHNAGDGYVHDDGVYPGAPSNERFDSLGIEDAVEAALRDSDVRVADGEFGHEAGMETNNDQLVAEVLYAIDDAEPWQGDYPGDDAYEGAGDVLNDEALEQTGYSDGVRDEEVKFEEENEEAYEDQGHWPSRGRNLPEEAWELDENGREEFGYVEGADMIGQSDASGYGKHELCYDEQSIVSGETLKMELEAGLEQLQIQESVEEGVDVEELLGQQPTSPRHVEFDIGETY